MILNSNDSDDINLANTSIYCQSILISTNDTQLFLNNPNKYFLLDPEEYIASSITITTNNMLINTKKLTLKRFASLPTDKSQAIDIKQLLACKNKKQLVPYLKNV